METTQKPYAFSRKVFCEGMRDGVPIALGYFAVSFSLGIAARKAGFTPFQGFLVSLLNNASAGEYAAFAIIMANATYLEVAIITLIANARYLLMSCALAQRFAPGTPFWHRLLIGYDVTDELFGITIARPGSLNPYYTYGAILLAAPAWAIGTALGIIAGNLLPLRAVSALSVALYGMFLAIIIPPARKSRVVAALVAISFALSFVCNYLPGISALSEGTRTILLTVLISSAAAVLFPVNPIEQEEEHDADGFLDGELLEERAEHVLQLVSHFAHAPFGLHIVGRTRHETAVIEPQRDEDACQAIEYQRPREAYLVAEHYLQDACQRH